MNLRHFCMKLAGVGDCLSCDAKHPHRPSLSTLSNRRRFLRYLAAAPLLGVPALYGSFADESSSSSSRWLARKLGTLGNIPPGDRFVFGSESKGTDYKRIKTNDQGSSHSGIQSPDPSAEKLIAQNTCIVPCVHRMHPYDVIPCQHVCYGPYGAVACHPYGDAVPCVHPVHPYGDYVPC